MNTKITPQTDRHIRPHEELYELCDCLRSVSVGLDSYEPESQHLPIIDSSGEEMGEMKTQTREVLPGLRFLREEVKRDLQVLQKVCPLHCRDVSVHSMI